MRTGETLNMICSSGAHKAFLARHTVKQWHLTLALSVAIAVLPRWARSGGHCTVIASWATATDARSCRRDFSVGTPCASGQACLLV